MAPSQSFATGIRVLIIEDEYVIAAMFEDMVLELGYEVSGFANTVASARKQIGKRDFDTVLLDLGLDQRGPELADLLMEMKMPFAFVTGYTQPFEPRHAHVPLLQKPFTLVQLRNVLHALLGPAPSGRTRSIWVA
jgi:DNA-binding response OmpR family regulator